MIIVFLTLLSLAYFIFSYETHKSDWGLLASSWNNGHPVIENERLYIIDFKDVLALNSKNGDVIWKSNVSLELSHIISGDDNYIYVGDKQKNIIYRINKEDGLLSAQINLDQYEFKYFLQPYSFDRVFIENGDMFIPDNPKHGELDQGDIVAIDFETGLELWRFPTGKRSLGSISFSDGALYFGGTSGHGSYQEDSLLFAVDANTGEELWKIKTWNEYMANKPTIQDDSIYLIANHNISVSRDDPRFPFGFDKSSFHVINKKTGEEVWNYDFNYYLSNLIVDDEVIYILESGITEGLRRGGIFGSFLQASQEVPSIIVIDRQSGEVLQKEKTPNINGLIKSEQKGTIYVAYDSLFDTKNVIKQVSTSDWEIKERVIINGDLHGIIIHENHLYTSTAYGYYLRKYSLSTD